MNPNDRIREQILQYFYDRNATATSKTGKKGSGVKISDVKKELKERHGLKQPQVMSNLTYLIDNGWVKTFGIHKTVNVGRGTVPSTTTFYEITAKGIAIASRGVRSLSRDHATREYRSPLPGATSSPWETGTS